MAGPGTKLPRHGAGIMCDKVRPARGLHRLTRDKIRPAQPLLQCFREKTRPARHKPPILGHFSCAGRTFSRIRPPPDQAGRTLYRTRGRCRYKTRLAYPVRRPTRYKTLPAHWPGGPNRYKTLPAHPKLPISACFARAGRTLYRSHHHAPQQGELCTAPSVKPGTKLSQHAQKGPFQPVLPEQGELCTARTTTTPSRENFVPHQAPNPVQNSPNTPTPAAQPVQNSVVSRIVV